MFFFLICFKNNLILVPYLSHYNIYIIKLVLVHTKLNGVLIDLSAFFIENKIRSWKGGTYCD